MPTQTQIAEFRSGLEFGVSHFKGFIKGDEMYIAEAIKFGAEYFYRYFKDKSLVNAQPYIDGPPINTINWFLNAYIERACNEWIPIPAIAPFLGGVNWIRLIFDAMTIWDDFSNSAPLEYRDYDLSGTSDRWEIFLHSLPKGDPLE